MWTKQGLPALFHVPKSAAHVAGSSRSPKDPKRHPLHVGIRRSYVCATSVDGGPGIVVGDAGVHGRRIFQSVAIGVAREGMEQWRIDVMCEGIDEDHRLSWPFDTRCGHRRQ